MKKTKLFVLFLSIFSCCLWADTARFNDMGFSPDGLQYLFGQYGELIQSDGSTKGYAEFFAVDTAKNEYVKNGTFKTTASGKTSGISGEKVFEQLITTEDSFISSYKIPDESNSVILYQVCGSLGLNDYNGLGLLTSDTIGKDAESSPLYKDVVEFRDFDNPSTNEVETYKVRINELVEGKGRNAESSFYLVVEQNTSSGKKRSFLVGNPQIKRKGVSGYRLNRVLRDKNGKSLVFVIEKQVEESYGPAVRFMVETVRLPS
ncbi:MAG: DUF2259 domain-containing protein [Spirochaetaceae bacterium]|nr:DUF2259 domain-containing protein [Spirochaetaceae bacterium]